MNNLSAFLLVLCFSAYTSLQPINSFPFLVLVVGISYFAFSYTCTSPKWQATDIGQDCRNLIVSEGIKLEDQNKDEKR